MNNNFPSFFFYLFLTYSSIILNAVGLEPFVFSEEEMRIKTELIDAFVQVGTDSAKSMEAGVKFEAAREEALVKKRYALLDWMLFDSTKSILGIRSEYLSAALESSLVYLVNRNQNSIASLFVKKNWSVIAGTLCSLDENTDVYEFLDKKCVMLSLILEMHKTMTTFTLEDTLLIANLLTLKHLTFGGAYAEGILLQRLTGFDNREFVKRLTLNFELPTFKRLNERFSPRVWGGHVSYLTERVEPQLDSHIKIVYGEGLLQGSSLEKLIEIQGPVECGNDSKITYVFRKPNDDKLSLIIIQIYGGYTKDLAVAPSAAYSLPDKSIGIIDLSLPDCVSNLFQGYQLKPENFAMTHARYMRIVSDFIGRIKDVYPGLPIFLQGSSFGGFFVSSYALLQSIGFNTAEFEKVYPEFVKAGFKEKFGQRKLSTIDGVISCFGGSFYVDEIVHTPGWSQYLRIPAFYHFNFDDDRVEFDSAVNALLPPQGYGHNPYVSLGVKRRSIQGFLEDSRGLPIEEVNVIKNVFVDDSAEPTLLGHSLIDRRTLDEQVLHFVGSSKAITPLRIERQKRLFEIYKSERKYLFNLYDFSAKDLCSDLAQFLRNLKRIKQKEAEGISFTKEQYFDNAMYLLFENLADMLQKFGGITGENADSLARLTELTSRHSQDLQSVRDKDLLIETNREECQKLLDPFLLDVATEFPEWKDFYKNKMKSYYENLKRYVTIKGFLREDLTEENVEKKLLFIRAKDDDVQQFLSNLGNTQRQIEKEGPICGAVLIESHMHLVNGDLDQVCFDFGKSLRDTDKDAFDVFLKEQKRDVKETSLHVMPQSLQNQALVNKLVMYPGFKEFYANAQKKYHDALMRSVSTRGLWKEAFKALKPTIRKRIEAKRQLSTLHLLEDSISASLL